MTVTNLRSLDWVAARSGGVEDPSWLVGSGTSALVPVRPGCFLRLALGRRGMIKDSELKGSKLTKEAMG